MMYKHHYCETNKIAPHSVVAFDFYFDKIGAASGHSIEEAKSNLKETVIESLLFDAKEGNYYLGLIGKSQLDTIELTDDDLAQVRDAMEWRNNDI